MKFDGKTNATYRESVDNAFAAILDKGDDFQKRIARMILESDMTIRVQPAAAINASGVTGLVSPSATNEKISESQLGLLESLGELYISIAEETIDNGGQRGCEGTLVHEGRHAYDFAQTIVSFSNADVNPLSIFDPTLYELELAAHKTAGDYMMLVNREEYIDEGLQLQILCRADNDVGCEVSTDGIEARLLNNYGLSLAGNQGPCASDILRLKQK